MSVPAEFIRDYFGIVHAGQDEKYAALGAHWNRSDYPIWPVVEPGRSFSFEQWDEQIQSAQDHGITPLLLLGVSYTPAWVTDEGVDMFPPSSVDQVREGVEKVVSRYSKPPFNLVFFEVSNEPNIAYFWRVNDPGEVHKEYIDRVLIPTAEIIHRHGGKVVAPSITMEWPDNSWPASEQTAHKCYNVGWGIKAIEDWLLYHDAWKHIDYFSLHYTKGDTEKSMLPHAENLMPLYDYLYDNWIAPGRIEGIWNTEEGLTAVEAGNVGDVALEPWEVPPYGQWVPRYTIPVIHWAIRRGWKDRDQYKVFWYNIRSGGVLAPTSIAAGEEVCQLADAGKALAVLTGLFADADTVDTYEDSVDVGFGLYPQDVSALKFFMPHRFKNYAFKMDNDLLVAVWMDLPGLETEGPSMQAVVKGLKGTCRVSSAACVHYLTGEEEAVSFDWTGDVLCVQLPRKPDPVIYLRIRG